ncbi:membrane dipeptidase [Gordonia sp. NPDC127522]|uniref:membrane dipeptidase n=1 Tax=Gordonia sp. NPDC127522 TaxID=3345390 RepID=UPI0036334471
MPEACKASATSAVERGSASSGNCSSPYPCCLSSNAMLIHLPLTDEHWTYTDHLTPPGSHCSARTGLDVRDLPQPRSSTATRACERSGTNPRNITDDQARACAATSGVVGITGVGIFLGPNTPTLEASA